MDPLMMLATNLTYGSVLGAVYGLATMGLSLIFGVLRIVNVGHGAFIMIGAYVAYWLFVLYGVIPLVSMVAALGVGMALGLATFYTVIRRLIGAPELASLLATFGIGILLEELAKLAWGPDVRGYSWHVGAVTVFGSRLPLSKVYAALASVAVAFALYVVLYRTRLGMAIRAVIQDAEGAMVCGINVGRVYAFSFALGIALTTVSGALVTLFIPVGINPYMGGEYTLKAFVIAVLGGLGSPWGAFIAGFIFGLIENGSYQLFSLLTGFEPFSMTKFLAFALLLVMLLLRPRGLLGR